MQRGKSLNLEVGGCSDNKMMVPLLFCSCYQPMSIVEHTVAPNQKGIWTLCPFLWRTVVMFVCLCYRHHRHCFSQCPSSFCGSAWQHLCVHVPKQVYTLLLRRKGVGSLPLKELSNGTSSETVTDNSPHLPFERLETPVHGFTSDLISC